MARALREGRDWPSKAADLRRAVPRWHFEMLADDERNTQLIAAIGRAVKPGMLVLDIGSGAGLTALVAARAGATVVSCEANPVVAELARQVVAANGYEDDVTIVPKFSTELQIGVDLPRPADVIVAEVIDADLFSEGAVLSIGDATDRLLKTGGQIIPASAELRMMMVEAWGVRRLNRVGIVDRLDLSPFNQVATQGALYAHLDGADMRMLAAPTKLFDIDFRRGAVEDSVDLKLDVIAGGVLDYAVVWFILQLDELAELSNVPGGRSHWKQTLFSLGGQRLVAGDQLQLTVEHDSEHLWLSDVEAVLLQGGRVKVS